MTENTDTASTSVVLTACVVCGVKLIGGVSVALIESGSGAGHVLYACRGCVKLKNLLTLDEQETLRGDGRLQYRK